jgi:hypothetical protein
MAEIEMLIDDLQSADLEQRYSACKSLRAQDQLPLFAVEALQIASTDPEPLISATAHMALLTHQSQFADWYTLDEPDLLPGPYTSQEILKILILSAVIALLTIPLISILLDERINDLWFIALPVIFIAGYVSYINFEDHHQQRFIALLSSIAVGLLIGTISFLLLSILFLSGVSAYRGY